MDLLEIIENTSKSKLAQARGKRQAHSTKEYPIFIKRLDHIVETFKNLGYTLEAKKSTSKNT